VAYLYVDPRFHGFHLGLRKSTEHNCQDKWLPYQGSNSEYPECEAGILTARSRNSVI
jgi:hypothetical protein